MTMLYNCLHRQQNQISAVISMRPVIPPTIPPMRTPVGGDSAPVLIGVVAAVLVGEVVGLPVAPSEVENAIGDTSALVGDGVAPVGILDMEVVDSSSSGQMPVVQGSLEQHPWKFPAEQTYHCLSP